MRIALALAFAAGLAVFAPSAHAEDFTFNVPVRVENMRFAEAGSVTCSVASGSQQISGRQEFPVADGGFRGTLAVTVNLPAGERRDAFTHYTCAIYLSFRLPDGALQYGGDFHPSRFVTEYPLRTGQALASSNMIISTEIPR